MIGKHPIATIAALARHRANQVKLTALLIPIMALCAAEAVAAPIETRAAKTQPVAMDAARFDGRWTIVATAGGACPVVQQSMIAVTINKAAESGAMKEIIIIAPPRVLGELRKELSAKARAKVKGELDKDLTRHPILEIEKALAREFNQSR